MGRFSSFLKKAFSVDSSSEEFSQSEILLLEKIALLVVRRRMTAPVLLFLESMGPMGFLGSQALVFLKPFLDFLSTPEEWELMTEVLGKRGSVGCLIRMIEQKEKEERGGGKTA